MALSHNHTLKITNILNLTKETLVDVSFIVFSANITKYVHSFIRNSCELWFYAITNLPFKYFMFALFVASGHAIDYWVFKCQELQPEVVVNIFENQTWIVTR